MKNNEMMKLRSIKFSSSPRVHLFLFFILDGAWVVWDVFSPPSELSPPLEWACWGGGYGYAGGGGYEYAGGAGLPDEPPAGEEGMNMVEEHYHPMNHGLEVEDMNMVGIHMVRVGVWIRWRSNTTDEPPTGGGGVWGRIWRLRWRWLKENTRAWCWRGIGLTMEWRGIGELIGSGRSLQNQGVQKVTLHL
jgi:hypothetical protein